MGENEFGRGDEEEVDEDEQEMMSQNWQARVAQMDETIGEMEGDLKTKMEYNWKLIYALDDMLYQRDVLYNILAQIDSCVLKAGEKSIMGDKILAIINEQPDDFSMMK